MIFKTHFLNILRWGLRLHGAGHLIEVHDLRAAGVDATYLADRDTWPQLVSDLARPGDLVLIMGARDPGLAELARRVVHCLPATGS